MAESGNEAPGASRGVRGKLAQLRNATVVDRRQISAQTADIVADVEFMRLHAQCSEFTMTSLERMYGLYNAVRHIVSTGVAGDFVETGVWRGGSSMMMASTLKSLGDTSRELWLYDTFEGMVRPGALDVAHDGQSASEQYEITPEWCAASLDDVRANMSKTGYPEDRLNFIEGRVEESIPAKGAPDAIALLRLDTDWYASTRHELEQLYPRLASGGVLLLDDYGHWEGAKKAVDEYLAANDVRAMLHRLDHTGRLLVKP